MSKGCDDGCLRIHEAENGSLSFGPFKIHSDWIRSISWSVDGERYVSINMQCIMPPHVQRVFSIVTGSDDRKVKVVDAKLGNVVFDTAFHDDYVRAVVFGTEFFFSCSDDRQVVLPKHFPRALNDRNRTVRIYDASKGTASGEAWTTGQTGYIRAIAISSNNKILAAGSDDHTIVLYDIVTRSAMSQPIRGHTGVSASGSQHVICAYLVEGGQVAIIFDRWTDARLRFRG
jgi:WD40 repeat protein